MQTQVLMHFSLNQHKIGSESSIQEFSIFVKMQKQVFVYNLTKALPAMLVNRITKTLHRTVNFGLHTTIHV